MSENNDKDNESWRNQYHTKWKYGIRERRNDRYHKDPAYREAVKQQHRNNYRNKTQLEADKFKDSTSLVSELGSIGQLRKVVFGYKKQKRKKVLTFMIKELAEALGGYAYLTIYRWISNEMLPAPVVEAIADSGRFGREEEYIQAKVYTEPEVLAIIEVLGKHQETMTQYRKTHHNTKAQIFYEVKEARKESGINAR